MNSISHYVFCDFSGSQNCHIDPEVTTHIYVVMYIYIYQFSLSLSLYLSFSPLSVSLNSSYFSSPFCALCLWQGCKKELPSPTVTQSSTALVLLVVGQDSSGSWKLETHILRGAGKLRGRLWRHFAMLCCRTCSVGHMKEVGL